MSVVAHWSEEQSPGAGASLALPVSQSHFLKLQLVADKCDDLLQVLRLFL